MASLILSSRFQALVRRVSFKNKVRTAAQKITERMDPGHPFVEHWLARSRFQTRNLANTRFAQVASSVKPSHSTSLRVGSVSALVWGVCEASAGHELWSSAGLRTLAAGVVAYAVSEGVSELLQSLQVEATYRHIYDWVAGFENVDEAEFLAILKVFEDRPESKFILLSDMKFLLKDQSVRIPNLVWSVAFKVLSHEQIQELLQDCPCIVPAASILRVQSLSDSKSRLPLKTYNAILDQGVVPHVENWQYYLELARDQNYSRASLELVVSILLKKAPLEQLHDSPAFQNFVSTGWKQKGWAFYDSFALEIYQKSGDRRAKKITEAWIQAAIPDTVVLTSMLEQLGNEIAGSAEGCVNAAQAGVRFSFWFRAAFSNSDQFGDVDWKDLAIQFSRQLQLSSQYESGYKDDKGRFWQVVCSTFYHEDDPLRENVAWFYQTFLETTSQVRLS